MRYYEPVWNKIKKKGTASVVAHPKAHARVIKAVTKEKWMDLAFKMENEFHYAILTHESSGTMITFTLVIRKVNILKNITEHML